MEMPPYVNAYSKLPELFNKIKEASVPTKFIQDFLYTKLGLKSTSNRAYIPLLKHLGFLDPNGIPTDHYKDYREETKSEIIMAERIRETYNEIFDANVYAYQIERNELTELVKRITGLSKGDKKISAIVGTFTTLCELADFEGDIKEVEEKEEGEKEDKKGKRTIKTPSPLGISYTINLNLPATTDIEVFNAIFKALKEHILYEK